MSKTLSETSVSSLRYYFPLPDTRQPVRVEADVCVYGATAGGVVAALQAKRLGKSVALVEFGRHLGGMTSGGLGATDIGNKAAIGGIARDFYRRLGRYYGREEAWTFEPHVAEKTFGEMLREADVPVYFEQRLDSVEKDGARLLAMTTEDGSVFRARVFIDTTYEGDLMAKASVSYRVGRESNATYGETLNGVQMRDTHQFYLPVDPYVVKGDASSGLLPHVKSAPLAPAGSGDNLVQAYNFRLCLSDDPNNRLPFPKPAGYDDIEYSILVRYIEAGFDPHLFFFLFLRVAPHKVDMNNCGPFSTDFIGGNTDYPEADYATRETIFQNHVRYQMGLMWFLANDARVPHDFQRKFNDWGLPADEFVETGGWPPQLYVREARRMTSEVVITEHHCVGRERTPDSIGLAAYSMDSHNCQRVVVDGCARNEGDVQVGGFGPYPISYRAIVPRQSECENLLVPACLSSSHIAYGSIRMEPVFMVLAQSAATAASISIDEKCAVQQIEYSMLRDRLLRDGQVLDWTAEAFDHETHQGVFEEENERETAV